VRSQRATRNQRLLSAALGATFLALGFGQKRSDRAATRAQEDKVPKSVQLLPQAKVRRTWTEIIRLLYEAIGQHRVVSIAAGVTFFSLLAIFPAIAALVAIYGLFADPASIQAQLSNLSSLLPGGAVEVIGDQLQRLASAGKTRLGATFAFSLAISLWSANAGMKALFDALNIVFGATDSRSFIKLNIVSLVFTVGGLVVAALAVGGIVVLPIALQYVRLGALADGIARIAPLPMLYFIVTIALAVIFRFGPDRQQAPWRWMTWGSAIAAFLWIVVSILFSWYAVNFGSYNKTYGSLGAVVGFMTWIWISCMVILAGAEIDALLEQPDRGSEKADTRRTYFDDC
jgi:membrane protein